MKLQTDAPLTHRILASLFDVSVVAALQMGVIQVLIRLTPSNEAFPFALALIPLFTSLLGLLYFLVPTLTLGGTFGKRLLGIRVTGLDGNDLPAPQIVLRETIGRFFGAFVLGWAWVFFTEKRRTAWDFIGKSWVTQDDEPSPARVITSFLLITACVTWTVKNSAPYLLHPSSPVASIASMKSPSDRIQLTRSEADQLVEMETQLLSQAEFTPVIEEGALVGYRVDAIQSGSELERLGLKNDDFLCGIDDDLEKVIDPDRAREVLFSLPATQSLSACVVRNGEERTLFYEIQD